MQDNFILENFTSAWIRCLEAWIPVMSVFSSFRKPCLLIDEKPQRIIDPHPKVHWCLTFMSSISQGVPEDGSTGKEKSLCITVLPSMQTLRSERAHFSPVMFFLSPHMSWLLKHLKDIEKKHTKLLHYYYHSWILLLSQRFSTFSIKVKIAYILGFAGLK